MSHTTSRVLYVPKPIEDAPAVVYGVGHAGAGAAPWRAVADHLGPVAEVRAYRLPGREKRRAEPPHATVEAAAAELAAAISEAAHIDGRPFLIAGACSGALIGRVALDQLSGPGVLGLCSFGQTAPTTAVPTLSGLPSAELRDWLYAHQGTPHEVLDVDALFRFFEPVVRADLRMAETYVHRIARMGSPLFLVRANGQTDVDLDLEPWRGDAAAGVHVLDVSAEGDLLDAHPDQVAAALRVALQPARLLLGR